MNNISYKTKHPLYFTWRGIINRCNSTVDRRYKDYGERGITVCDRWLDFNNFVNDMGRRPLKTSLDRINNDGNYEPLNCRWATALQQAHNRRLKSTNISGYHGVNWHKTANKWRAEKDYNNKRYYLGLYKTPQDANAAIILFMKDKIT